MYRVYFANKGSTVKAGMPNIWPTKEIAKTPREFTGYQGLMALITPTFIDKSYYIANIVIWDTNSWGYRNDYHGNEYLWVGGNCLLHANIAKKQLDINSRTNYQNPLHKMSPQELDLFWQQREMALHLLREALTEFDRYFPAQGVS